jgi:hypothetical protein
VSLRQCSCAKLNGILLPFDNHHCDDYSESEILIPNAAELQIRWGGAKRGIPLPTLAFEEGKGYKYIIFLANYR